MRLSADEFRGLKRKAVTLLGMSGVGKTLLANRLDPARWFNYSGDYRIGTRYLNEDILDKLKLKMMAVPFLAELLRSDSIYIRNNITVDNLEPVTAFLGKPGDPARDGLPLAEFKHRLRLHHDAEVQAMRDVPAFIQRGMQVYGYPHFVNDAGGSLCELRDPDVFRLLAEHTVILYIHADERQIEELCRRQARNPKPLYYPEAFLDRALAEFQRERAIAEYDRIDPDEFTRWAFPRLSRDRLERYRGIAREHGYTVGMAETQAARNAEDFVELVARAIDRGA